MTSITVTDQIGCKYPVSIVTDRGSYSPRGMSIPIFLASNSHAQRVGARRFVPALTTKKDPNP